MDDQFRPKINCRFKLRQDLEGWIGFFETKGVLTFNEVGAHIVSQMVGEKTIDEISESVRLRFPDVQNSEREVTDITNQLREADFF